MLRMWTGAWRSSLGMRIWRASFSERLLEACATQAIFPAHRLDRGQAGAPAARRIAAAPERPGASCAELLRSRPEVLHPKRVYVEARGALENPGRAPTFLALPQERRHVHGKRYPVRPV